MVEYHFLELAFWEGVLSIVAGCHILRRGAEMLRLYLCCDWPLRILINLDINILWNSP